MNTHTDALLASAELQDNVLIALNDLERLQTLLNDSHEALQAGFFGLVEHVGGDAQAHLKNAMKALQFQDMATQLIAHTGKRLRHCADRLARDAFAGDEDDESVIEAAPLRPNPVTQSEMDTGFVELF
jgi:cell division protein YceG involved in septum cleavage